MPCRLPFFSPFHFLRIKKYKWISPPPPPPKGFPLLKLPHFPLKNIINQLNIEDVLELTMLFSRFKRAVQTARIEVDLIHFQFGVYYDMIRIPTNSYLFHSCCIFEPNFMKDEMKTEWKVGKLNGEVVPTCRATEGGSRFNVIKVMTESDNGMEDKVKVMERITMHLHTILNVKEVTVQCYRKWEFKDLFLWRLYPTIRRIQIHPTSAAHRIDNSWTQSFDDILGNTSCENLEFKFSEYPAVGINRLFKEWISGKSPDLEELHFFVPGNKPTYEEACLIGITTVESFCKLNEYDRCERIDTYWLRSPPVDIKRATDGRLATVIFDKHCVSLYIWHEKHLNDPDLVRKVKYT